MTENRMILYCKKCNQLMKKTTGTVTEGSVVRASCPRCHEENVFLVQYRPVRYREERSLHRNGG